MAKIMGTTNEMNANHWVDARLAWLDPDQEWRPDTSKGLARLRDRQHNGSRRGRRLTWMAVGAVAACVCFMALPVSGVLAHRCLECSVAILQSLSASRAVQADVKPEDVRKIAPDFILNNASGEAVKLSDFKGKVVLLNFWATWCEGCKVEIPEFIEFQNEYKDKGLVVIGVSTDKDGWKAVKPFVQEKRINYTVLLGEDEICKLYGVEAMPVTLLIDREGRIAASHEGVMNKAAGEREIKTLVEERPKNAAK
jgi:peroxiredoxin